MEVDDVNTEWFHLQEILYWWTIDTPASDPFIQWTRKRLKMVENITEFKITDHIRSYEEAVLYILEFLACSGARSTGICEEQCKTIFNQAMEEMAKIRAKLECK